MYATLFPCPRCSTSDTLQQVFHHKGANGRELRYELSFLSWDDRHVAREGITLRRLHDARKESFAPIKAVLSKVKIAVRISECVVATSPTAAQRPLMILFTVYARDVFAYLGRNDLDSCELVCLAWRQMLMKMRASLPLRILCMELIMALDGTWVVPIIYNPDLHNYIVDRRQFKLPQRSAELDSQLMQDHLRNSFFASVVVVHEWGDDMTGAGIEATGWVCEMLCGLDNCHIGELHFSQVHPRFEDIATVFVRAMSGNRPRQLSMTFNSDEQFRRFITLKGFFLGGALRDTEHMWFSVDAALGPVMPVWKMILFISPCIRKLEMHYINESSDASGLRYVVGDIIEDFLSLEHMGATDMFDFYLFTYRPVPFLRDNHVSTRSNVRVADASWCRIGDFACDEFCFLNKNCHKELIVYISVTEYESVVLCRMQ
ncbi:hypothetical protein AAVH_19406 [Aphelenchoides avenae]|nr:hypothetical protein AAVH_19406 [Aphelenchus avenae]